MSSPDSAVAIMLANRKLTKAAQVLSGIVTGIVADGALHDLEVQMLRTWLLDNAEVMRVWPGSAIARALDDVLADGVITNEERAHLLETLQHLIGTDFSHTGSVTPEIAKLPFDEDGVIDLRDSGVCLTGEFAFGTRSKCEKLTEQIGGVLYASVSKKVAYLVVGSHVSPSWANTSYGLKIKKAMELRSLGHDIAIIHESRWLDAVHT